MDQTLEDLETLYNNPNAQAGVPTGYTDLDDKTQGLHNGELTIIAARPSIGKSTLAVNIIAEIARDVEYCTAVFSMEMTRKEVIQRILARESGVSYTRIRQPKLLSDEDWPLATLASSNIKDRANIHINDTRNLTAAELRSESRRLKQNNPDLKVIVIDYLQLIKTEQSREAQHVKVADISRELKSLTWELDLPIIAISQLNRAAEDTTGSNSKRPTLINLAESDAIGRDADNVILLYKDPQKNNDRMEYEIIDLIIRKQRNGPQGTVELEFHKEFMRFQNMRIR